MLNGNVWRTTQVWSDYFVIHFIKKPATFLQVFFK
jgi:hypothetical protein